MPRILIVEDDRDLANITEMCLRHSGYETDTSFSCADALRLIKANCYDLLLLDVMLPDNTGDTLCAEIRSRHACPIIFTSCLDDSETIINALKNGGDDYIVKPIKYNELLARIEANLRRWQAQNHDARGGREGHLRLFKHFTVDTLHRCVLIDDAQVELSAIEYALLLYFIDNPEKLLLYEELYSQVWKHDSCGDVRTVMVHVSNLRKKIDPNRLGLIGTVRGAGYIYSDV